MKKIMFNDKFLLTQAVLDGRKTQTRRIINPQPTYQDNCGICWKGYAYGINPIDFKEPFGSYMNFVSGTEYDKSCRRFRKGEVVAVAQSYETISNAISETESKEKSAFYCKVMKFCFPNAIIHKDKEEISGWYNKMFVRGDLMPNRIRITNVRVERLQDISDECCLKEGVRKVVNENGMFCPPNCEIYRMTTGEFLKTVDYPKEKVFAICNYVPNWHGEDSMELVRNNFKNCYTFYPE